MKCWLKCNFSASFGFNKDVNKKILQEHRFKKFTIIYGGVVLFSISTQAICPYVILKFENIYSDVISRIKKTFHFNMDTFEIVLSFPQKWFPSSELIWHLAG